MVNRADGADRSACGCCTRRAMLVGVAAAAAGCAGAPRATAAPGPDGQLRLTYDHYPELARADGQSVVDIEGGRIFVRRQDGSAKALSLRCTHQGCLVGGPENGQLRCPCHGSRFDLEGGVVEGPAKRPLAALPSQVGPNEIVVTLPRGEV